MGGADSVATQIALLSERVGALNNTMASLEKKIDKRDVEIGEMSKTLVSLTVNAEKINRIEDKLTETRKAMYDHFEKDETPADYITKKMGAATFAIIIALGSVIFNNLAQALLNAFR